MRVVEEGEEGLRAVPGVPEPSGTVVTTGGHVILPVRVKVQVSHSLGVGVI